MKVEYSERYESWVLRCSGCGSGTVLQECRVVIEDGMHYRCPACGETVLVSDVIDAIDSYGCEDVEEKS